MNLMDELKQLLKDLESWEELEEFLK